MIKRSTLTLVTAVLAAGFASPVLADCLESGAAESCGGGGYGTYAESWPDYQAYHGVFDQRGMNTPYERR
jgi:hypothetical protein